MDSSEDKLSPLQRELLRAFFCRERGFFLTGGAALAGFYLRHRATADLDLFAVEPDLFDRGRYSLRAAADALGAEMVVRQKAPGFERYVVQRGADSVVVDLVLDRVPQEFPVKPEQEGIRIDRLEEIVINKLTTVLSRAEEKDLVDLLFLERAGFALESALPGALRKDGGCTPATLAWLVSQIEISDRAILPGGVSPGEMRRFLADLVKRLLRTAAPGRPEP